MSNPFATRAPALSGPATDIVPIVPSDTIDLPVVALALYVQTGGSVAMVTEQGNARTVLVADFSILPVGLRRVNATGTTASGLHAMVVA